MKFQLRQTFSIDSARYLPKLPKEHPCARIHGHRFEITLIWEGILDQMGWVKDYHEVAHHFEAIKKQLDHRLLNEIPGLENPTSEHLARFIFEQVKKWLPELSQVIVAETAQTECRFPA